MKTKEEMLKELEAKNTTYAVYGYRKLGNQVSVFRDFDGMFCKEGEMEMFMSAVVDTLSNTIRKVSAESPSDCLIVYMFLKDMPNKGFQLTPFVIGVKTEEYNKVLDKFIS